MGMFEDMVCCKEFFSCWLQMLSLASNAISVFISCWLGLLVSA